MISYSQYSCVSCGDITLNWDLDHLWPCPFCGDERLWKRGGFVLKEEPTADE